MQQNSEISALLKLIDDPDEEVFGAVSHKLLAYGRNIIPNLENLWETIPNEEAQSRIELLIHQVHYADLAEDFRQWSLAGHHDLTVGALLAAKFQYPDLATAGTIQEIEKLRRNIWLELNNYLTPLEQARIVSGIVYNYYGLKGTEQQYVAVNDFLINKVLESKKGNQLSNGLLYMLLCERLDIPIKAIGVPRQFVLAYLKPGYSSDEASHHINKIEFYIDPTTGQVFTHKDMESYFKRIAVPPTYSYFRPLSNKRIIQHLLEEMSKCFEAGTSSYKCGELLQLAKLLDQ